MYRQVIRLNRLIMNQLSTIKREKFPPSCIKKRASVTDRKLKEMTANTTIALCGNLPKRSFL